MNIASHTAEADLYPAFISINQHERGVSITVRAAETCDNVGRTKPGNITEIILNHDDFQSLIADSQQGIKKIEKMDPNQKSLTFD